MASINKFPIRTFASSTQKILTGETINRQVVEAQYAVRGELVIRAEQLRAQLASGARLPFSQITPCNIGNPQELGQKPITFFRQVMAMMQYPELTNHKIFPEDAIARARKYSQSISGGVGAYSGSQGVKVVRDEVAQFIEARDKFSANADDVFLTDGASAGIKQLMQIMIRDSKDAILTPIPQYPLYSATLTLLGGERVGYYLDEDKNWGLSLAELKRALAEGRKKGLNVRGLVVINPGNPTGQCLKQSNMEEIVDFCHTEKIVLLSDEVYQTNIYSTTPFTSFKSVTRSMGAKYSNFELASFHSVSKGFLGECGQRGGYLEIVGFDQSVRDQFYKLSSISLCSNVPGQIMTGLMVNPPRAGQPSYELYQKERDGILDSLKRRAQKVASVFNSVPGIKCNIVEGAMYAFPQIQLPPKAVEAAKKVGKAADTFYCLALLERTGICVVPGSGFGQRDGTWHFRTTILPPEQTLDKVLDSFKEFHLEFLKKFS